MSLKRNKPIVAYSNNKPLFSVVFWWIVSQVWLYWTKWLCNSRNVFGLWTFVALIVCPCSRWGWDGLPILESLGRCPVSNGGKEVRKKNDSEDGQRHNWFKLFKLPQSKALKLFLPFSEISLCHLRLSQLFSTLKLFFPFKKGTLPLFKRSFLLSTLQLS